MSAVPTDARSLVALLYAQGMVRVVVGDVELDAVVVRSEFDPRELLHSVTFTLQTHGAPRSTDYGKRWAVSRGGVE